MKSFLSFFFTLFFFTLFFTTTAFSMPEANCDLKNARMIIKRHLKSDVVKTPFCFNSKTYHLYSRSCRGDQCGILKKLKAKDLKRSQFVKMKGNPGFLKCEALGGIPEIVIVKIGAKSFTTDRCLDPSDNSFVHTGFLF